MFHPPIMYSFLYVYIWTDTERVPCGPRAGRPPQERCRWLDLHDRYHYAQQLFTEACYPLAGGHVHFPVRHDGAVIPSPGVTGPAQQLFTEACYPLAGGHVRFTIRHDGMPGARYPAVHPLAGCLYISRGPVPRGSPACRLLLYFPTCAMLHDSAPLGGQGRVFIRYGHATTQM